MRCDQFEELTFERLDGDLDRETVVLLDAHALRCKRCSEFALLLGDEGPTVDLTDDVLALTSARQPLDRALRQLDLDLPGLANVLPEGDFVGDVMAATIEADRRRLHRRLADAWHQLAQRPRIALEGAYLGALAGFLLVGMPWSPLAGVPQEVLAQLQKGEATVRTTVSQGTERIQEFSTATWSRAEDLVTYSLGGAADGPAVLVESDSDATWRDIVAEWFTSFWDNLIGPGVEWLLSPWIDTATDTDFPSRTHQPNEQTDDDRSSNSA